MAVQCRTWENRVKLRFTRETIVVNLPFVVVSSRSDSPRPTVLVVDDDANLRAALRRWLVDHEYRVLTAGEGMQALALLDEQREIALMLCDIRLPGMTGVDLVPRALEKHPDLAIIMLTAYGEPQTAVECMKRGAYDYLIKPIDLEDLGLQIDQALRRQQLERERRELEAWLAREVAERTRQLEATVAHVELLAVGAVTSLVDRYESAVGAHPTGATVAGVARALGEHLGLGGSDLDELVIAAHVHRVAAEPSVRAALSGFANYSNVAALLDEAGRRDAPLGNQIVRAARRYAELGLRGVQQDRSLEARVVAALSTIDARRTPDA